MSCDKEQMACDKNKMACEKNKMACDKNKMACDKHIILAILILMVTTLIVYMNMVTMMGQEEPKVIILTKLRTQTDALKRNKVNLNSDTVKTPKKHEVLNLDSVDLEIYPFLKNLRRKYKEVMQFEDYLKRFNKSYSGIEWERRFSYFKESLEELSLKEKQTGARHGLTKFSDWSKWEFARVMNNTSYRIFGECLNRHLSCPPHNDTALNSGQLFNDSFVSYLNEGGSIPDSFDWRDHDNVIGPVLDQKLCNGCWAFSIVGVMESMTVIQRVGSYVRRSIQELIDCSRETEGCKNGHVTLALHFLCHYDLGLVTEDDYPLLLVTEPCKYRHEHDIRKVKQFWTNCNMNEEDILRRLQFGPVIAVINAEPLRNYVDGIIQRSCYRSSDGFSIDHVVQIVGYNLKNDIPYYIVKNSWGSDWGEDGYFRLEYNKNLCGVKDEVTFLDVKDN